MASILKRKAKNSQKARKVSGGFINLPVSKRRAAIAERKAAIAERKAAIRKVFASIISKPCCADVKSNFDDAKPMIGAKKHRKRMDRKKRLVSVENIDMKKAVQSVSDDFDGLYPL